MNQLLRRTNWPNLDGVPIRKLTSRVICTFPKSLSSSTRASPAQLSSSLFQLNSVTSSYTVPCCSWSSCWCGVCPILALLLDWSLIFFPPTVSQLWSCLYSSYPLSRLRNGAYPDPALLFSSRIPPPFLHSSRIPPNLCWALIKEHMFVKDINITYIQQI